MNIDPETGEIRQTFLRTPYNYNTDAASIESGLCCEDATLAQQHFREECDINVIVERFGITGQMPEHPRMPSYGDYSNIVDFKSAMDAVRQATESFMELPANIRARFENDPQRLMDFINNDENTQEAHRLGLLREDYKPPEPPKGDPVDPPKGGTT